MKKHLKKEEIRNTWKKWKRSKKIKGIVKKLITLNCSLFLVPEENPKRAETKNPERFRK